MQLSNWQNAQRGNIAYRMQDRHYWITENPDMPSGEGNLDLWRETTYEEIFAGLVNAPRPIGSANKVKGRWIVDINEPDSTGREHGCKVIGDVGTQFAAACLLWEKRLEAAEGPLSTAALELN